MSRFLLTICFGLFIIIPNVSNASEFDQFDLTTPELSMTCWNSHSFSNIKIEKRDNQILYYHQNILGMSNDIIERREDKLQYIVKFDFAGEKISQLFDFKNKKFYYKNSREEGFYDCK